MRRADVDSVRREARVVRERGRAPDGALVAAVRRAGCGGVVIPVRVLRLRVADMDCRGCPARVGAALRGVAGVRDVALLPREARVAYDGRRTDAPSLVAAVRRAGFQAHPLRSAPPR